MTQRLLIAAVLLSSAALLPSCSRDACDLAKPTSCDKGQLCQADADGKAACVPGCLLEDATTCPEGKVCENVAEASPLCFAPVELRGVVKDALAGTGIAAARVAARDSNGVVIGSVATSDAAGKYTLPIPSKRQADGTPVAAQLTLRADAQAYASFPGALRPALPIDVASSASNGNAYVVESSLTTLALLPIDVANAGSIRGKVEGDKRSGTLVTGGGSSAVADASGEFVLFNIPAGTAHVRGYGAGVQYTPVDATVAAGAETRDVVLTPAAGATLATVTGNLIFNANNPHLTNVVLVAKETWIPSLETGEVARGLRADGVTGTFSIGQVPDGDYVMIASLDNDNLVRDPSPGGNSDILAVAVASGAATYTPIGGGAALSTPSFKIRDAVEIVSPGATGIEAVTGTPTFRWKDVSSEDSYLVEVFNALGEQMWTKTIPNVTGSAEASLTYDTADATAKALEPGMVYQFRVTAMKAGGPLTRSEQLRGLFTVQ
jgi:hypothetical protein